MVGEQVRQLRRVLVANRGEIACRVFWTLKKLNIASVAVCSDIDVKSQHAQMADKTYILPGKTSSETYLNIPRILDIIEKDKIDAVHPGYGFLSENYEFAQSLVQKNVIFIGPSVQALKDMGSKSAAKKIMEKAGVPVVPGYHGDNEDPSHLLKKSEEIGFPVMIKAVMGGGGKGMKICHSKDTFFDLLESAKRESKTHFRDEKVIIEKYIARSRHIEVQIFGDNYGNIVHLFERDCSVQRRHQKVLEESPSKALTEEERRTLGDMAVLAGKAVSYRGAGTVEFIYDCDEKKFYFMEMNTRLQVEHPVTEMVTRQDLVEWQLKVAAGQPLPLKQDEIRTKGHAIEARIYSENTENAFLPDIGILKHLTFPKGDTASRIESGVREGDEITMYYDPMIAKIICYGDDRENAIHNLESKLQGFLVSGVKTNIEFVRKILRTKDFRDGEHDTGFIKENLSSLLDKSTNVPQNIASVFSALITSRDVALSSAISGNVGHNFIVESLRSTWLCKITLINGVRIEIQRLDDDKVSVFTPSIIDRKGDEVRCLVEGEVSNVFIARGSAEDKIGAFINGDYFEMKILSSMKSQETASVNNAQSIISPMPSKVSQIKVKEGQKVKKGDVLVTLEAMKMEHAVLSTKDGVIQTVHCAEGQMVSSGYTLVSFKE